MRVSLRFLPFFSVACATFFSSVSGANAQQTAWTTFKGDNARTGASTAQVGLPMALQWRFSSDAPARSYSSSPLIIGAPGNQRAIFAAGSQVFALDINTGAQVWRTPEISADIETPLTLLSSPNGDLILGAQADGTVFALKSTDGGRVWATPVRAGITRTGPLVHELNGKTTIFVLTNTGRIRALDSTGKLDPEFNVPLDQYGQTPAGNFALSPDGNRLYAQLSSGRLFCVDAIAGRILWRYQLASRPSVTPVVTNGYVIAVVPNQIAALRLNEGQAAWRFRPRGDINASPAVSANTLFYGTRNGWFQALDALTGTVKWEKNLGFSFSGSPIALPGVVIAGTSNGLLVGLSPQNGEVVWQYRLKTEREVTRRVRPTGGDTGAGAGAGNPDGGAPAPATESTTTVQVFPVSSAPAAVDSTLLVLGDNAALYSFTTRPFDADPPRAILPLLTVPDSRRELISLDIVPTTQQIIPGTGPMYFALELDDVGSGVNAQSITVTLDGEAMAADRVEFDAESGVLTITILDPRKNDPALSDGVKTLAVSARDYAGNELRYSGTFLIDNTAPAPEPPVVEVPAGEIIGGPVAP